MEAASRIESSGVNQAAGRGRSLRRAHLRPPWIVNSSSRTRSSSDISPAVCRPRASPISKDSSARGPQLIEELGLADKVNAGLRLLDAAGVAEPWAEKPKKAWEKPAFAMGAAALAAVALIGCAVLAHAGVLARRDDRQAQGRKSSSARSRRPRTNAPFSSAPRATARRRRPTCRIGSRRFRRNESRSFLDALRHVQGVDRSREPGPRCRASTASTKDSNGHVRISLNAGAFGPGDYMVQLDGLNMRRESLPVAWFRFSVAR